MPSIDRNSRMPYYLQVYEQIAHGIETGLYPPGRKLPSIRECARELGVSNTTIELAYQKLTAEGYVQARRGSGYTICAIAKAPVEDALKFKPAYREALDLLERDEAERTERAVARYDFAYDAVDAATFPFSTWARISREVLFSKGAEDAFLYTDPQGLCELREEIAHYLGIEYGIECIGEQVLVMPTTRNLISAVLSLFDPATTTFAMEDPGYDEVGRHLESSGFRVARVPVTTPSTWDAFERTARDADIAFVTPACQFPSNRVMPLDMRLKLVNWAQETGAYIIDDEYGWEFQTAAERVPPLASFDEAGCVITMGTFSNSFAPALCLSYAVLPPQLVLKWRKRNRGSHAQAPWQTQASMAAFMREEHWRNHVRRIRTSAQNKRAELDRALADCFGDAIEVVIGPSSLFALVQTRDGRSEGELISAAEDAGVRVYPTRRYWHDDVPADWRYVLVGFAGIPLEDIAPGVQTLARAWQ